MNIEALKERLRDALSRYSGESYARFKALDDGCLIEETGAHREGATGDYCQIEANVLQTWRDHGSEILHVTLTASDGYRTVGGNIYFYSDGRTEVDSALVEYVNGIPKPVG